MLDRGRASIRASYEENVPHRRLGNVDRSLGESRVGLGGEGLRARFRHIKIERDLCYTEVGEFGVAADIALGPGEYFLLGDNSAQSVDSRTFGPVRAEKLIGRPRWVVWPLARARALGQLRPLEPRAADP